MHCLATPLMGQSYLRLESIHDAGCEMNRIKGSPLCFFSFASLWLVIWTNKREDNLLREECIPLSATVRRSKSSQLQRVCVLQKEREGERRWGEEREQFMQADLICNFIWEWDHDVMLNGKTVVVWSSRFSCLVWSNSHTRFSRNNALAV